MSQYRENRLRRKAKDAKRKTLQAEAPPPDRRCEFCGARCAGAWCRSCSDQIEDLSREDY